MWHPKGTQCPVRPREADGTAKQQHKMPTRNLTKHCESYRDALKGSALREHSEDLGRTCNEEPWGS
eukprot:2630601-Alexandrium_andersonii.AAC.1